MMLTMDQRNASLWVEIVLALTLITLITIVLNAGVFWLILKRAEEERRTDLAEALVDGMVAQLEVAARAPASGPRPAEILGAYATSALNLDSLYIVGADARPLHVVAGTPPEVLDGGLRVALFGRDRDIRVDGSVWGDRGVEVTAPVILRGGVNAAIRVRLPLASPSVFGSPSAFTVTYTTSTGVLIAIFGFSLFRRRLIRPIALVREGTRRIAEGEFGHQVEVDAALELRLLCDSLNAMSTELSQYRARTADQVERLRRANIDLQAAQAALVRSERLAGVGRLAAGLAHEIGNPLSAVLGFVEFLEQPVEDEAMQEDLLRRSRLELERIHGIIRGLLDYSRLGSGAVEPVDVVSVVRDAVDLVRHIPGVRAVEVTLEPASQAGGTVRMQRDLLQQVFVNILLNAAHAARLSDVPVVTVGFQSHADHLAVIVRDNGPGFDDVALERAVEPFFTTKEPGQGTGLGLATAARIVEGAHGELELANQPDGGARVEVRLPYEDAA